jgi:ribosome biogenesis GTPase A
VGRNAYDDEEVALALLAQMLRHHRDRLLARYKLGDLTGLGAAPDRSRAGAQRNPKGHGSLMGDEDVLAEIGRKRAPLLTGGLPNVQKAAEIAIHDFRSGSWGPVTLETLDEFALWTAQAAVADAEREAKRAARSGRKKTLTQRGQDGADGGGPG